MSEREHRVGLVDPRGKRSEHVVTAWRIEGGWLDLVTEYDDRVEHVLLPPGWSMPVEIITTYEEE